MVSPFAGVTEKEVPDPLGRIVVEPELLFEQEIELKYAEIDDAEPPAIASVSVYVVAALSTVEPVDALVPVPLVVVESTVVAPFLIATVNWSVLVTRPTTCLIRVMRGFASLVMVQEITSPGPGVIEKDVADPLGNVVADPVLEFVHEMEDS